MTKDAFKALSYAKTAMLAKQAKTIAEIGKKSKELREADRTVAYLKDGFEYIRRPGLSEPQKIESWESPQFKEAAQKRNDLLDEILEAGRLHESEEAMKVREVADQVIQDSEEKVKKAVYAIADLEAVFQEYIDDFENCAEAVRIAGSDFIVDGREVPTGNSYMVPDDILGKINELRATRFYREALAGRGEA